MTPGVLQAAHRSGCHGGVQMDVSAERTDGVVGVVWVVEHVDGRGEVDGHAACTHVGPERMICGIGVFLASRCTECHVARRTDGALLVAEHDAHPTFFIHREE